MAKTEFSTKIKAPAKKVWDVLWTDDTYRKWTSVFHEGSYVVTDWKEGSKALFLAPNGDGMYSTIAKNIPNEYMSIKHIGVVKDGKEQPLDEESKKWSGSLENYTLKETNGETKLIVDVDIAEEYKDFFNGVFPKALNIVKELAEK